MIKGKSRQRNSVTSQTKHSDSSTSTLSASGREAPGVENTRDAAAARIFEASWPMLGRIYGMSTLYLQGRFHLAPAGTFH